MLVTLKNSTRTYESDGQLIGEMIVHWRLLGFIPIYSRRLELWRKASPITDELREQVLAIDSWTCVYCGNIQRHQLTAEHRVPPEFGGTTVLDNLVTSCVSCHDKKQGRLPEEANMVLIAGRFGRTEHITLDTIAASSGILDSAPPVAQPTTNNFIQEPNSLEPIPKMVADEFEAEEPHTVSRSRIKPLDYQVQALRTPTLKRDLHSPATTIREQPNDSSEPSVVTLPELTREVPERQTNRRVRIKTSNRHDTM